MLRERICWISCSICFDVEEYSDNHLVLALLSTRLVLENVSPYRGAQEVEITDNPFGRKEERHRMVGVSQQPLKHGQK